MEYHATVMGPEAVAWLAAEDKDVVVDATVGHGGHALLIGERMVRGGLLVILDERPEALAVASARLAGAPVRVLAIQGNFRRLPQLLRAHGVNEVGGVLYDQGLSSADLEGDLGYSFQRDAPLDMRRSLSAPQSAADLLATLDAKSLGRLLREYGEEPWAERIAHAVVRERVREPITRTSQFVSLIERTVPRRAWPKDIHVATKSMMALRYAVNDDLGAIRESIEGIVPMLRVGGRCVCISFCSLEDRAVKQAMRAYEHPCICPKDMPVCACGRQPMLKVLTKRAVRPSEAEIAANRRARSAALRAAERI